MGGGGRRGRGRGGGLGKGEGEGGGIKNFKKISQARLGLSKPSKFSFKMSQLYRNNPCKLKIGVLAIKLILKLNLLSKNNGRTFRDTVPLKGQYNEIDYLHSVPILILG